MRRRYTLDRFENASLFPQLIPWRPCAYPPMRRVRSWRRHGKTRSRHRRILAMLCAWPLSSTLRSRSEVAHRHVVFSPNRSAMSGVNRLPRSGPATPLPNCARDFWLASATVVAAAALQRAVGADALQHPDPAEADEATDCQASGAVFGAPGGGSRRRRVALGIRHRKAAAAACDRSYACKRLVQRNRGLSTCHIAAGWAPVGEDAGYLPRTGAATRALG